MFLKAICPEHLHEEIEGDLIQKFNRDVKEVGERRAKRRLIKSALPFFRPGIVLRNKFSFNLNRLPMLQNYFKTTYRHLLKSKVNFAFKLGGLTLALFSFLVISLYISYHVSFDRFNEDYENIYRITTNRDEDGNMQQHAMAPSAVGPALKAEFAEVRSFSRLHIPQRALIRYNEKSFRPNGFVDADSTVFDVFTFRFVEGDKHALNKPRSVVLTRSLAEQIFDDVDPIGKVLSFVERPGRELNVTAIIEDFPSNSHLDIRALFSYDALADSAEMTQNPWQTDAYNTYIRLEDKTELSGFSRKMNAMVQKHLVKREDGSEKKFSISLQPLKEIYFGPPLKNEFNKKGDARYIYFFSILGVFLLVIACINYINLSIADFNNRFKEISVRKILGARKKQIAFQVTLEAVFFCSSALLVSVTIVYFLFPDILRLLEPNLLFAMLLDRRVILLIAFSMFLLILFSAVYPSIHLSSASPANALKGSGNTGKKSDWGRHLLLVQLVISIICISATLGVRNQINFIRNTDLGYDRYNVVSLLMPNQYPIEKAPVLKAKLAELASVESVSFSYYMISGAPYLKAWYKVEENGEMKQKLLNEVFIDHDFLPTMNIEIKEGRNFNVDNKTDSKSAFIVNEAAVKEFGWENPVGKRISVGYGEIANNEWEGTVVGVVSDFNIRPLREKIEPLVMRLQYESWPGFWLNIRVKGSINEAIAEIKAVYESVLPGYLADYRLVEDIYERQYQNENKAFTTLQVGTWIVALICASGIFSLSVFMSGRRMKEFGIRKVLGASARQITGLHVWHFLRIAIMANIIAIPVAYWILREWLNDFVYKSELNVLVFGAVTGFSLLLVVVSAGYSSLRAGNMNPVDVIKIE
jgi:putative ABC transport system permease protein